jgi:hypothetical protein
LLANLDENVVSSSLANDNSQLSVLVFTVEPTGKSVCLMPSHIKTAFELVMFNMSKLNDDSLSIINGFENSA